MKTSAIRTEGVDLVDATEEFSRDLIASLGVHAYDPAEVERNIESQIEKQMGLEPKDLLDEVKRDGRRLRSEDAPPEVIERTIRLAKQDLVRLRNDEFKRREELLVKIKFLQDMLPPPLPPPPQPVPVVPSMAGTTSAAITSSKSVTGASSTSKVSTSMGRTSVAATSNRKRTIDDSTATTTLRPFTSSSLSASTAAAAAETLRCPICEQFTTTSNRQLNLHLNNCLAQKEKQERAATSSTTSAGEQDEEEDEDSILDGEHNEEDIRAERRRKHTKEAWSKNAVAVKDDWDSAYCKRRLMIHARAYLAWITTWNDVKDTLPEMEAQAKAEEAYEREVEQVQDRLRLRAHIASSSVSSDNDELDDNDVAAESQEQNEQANDESEDGSEPVHEVVAGTLRTPQRLWNRLLPHQRQALPWLFHHHEVCNGAVLGDEMGLGKTLQAISFLASLKTSGLLPRPVLVIAPATTLSQWVQEFNQWSPKFRVFVLHDSFGSAAEKSRGLPPRTGPEVVSRAFEEHEADVVLTSTQGLVNHSTSLLPQEWSYVILDEAHVIRNPDIQITLACKQVRTCHRIALTGAPIQNRLRELWSLFDFVCPRKLGTLPMFEQYFAEPIRIGGMMGASPQQVLAAYAAAKSLRDTVTPFMLRRMKKDIETSLPTKTERVAFFRLTPIQRETYLKYLQSDQVNQLLLNARGGWQERKESAGKTWRAIATLRKICNHPDLLTGKEFKREFQGGYEKELGEVDDADDDEDLDIDPSLLRLDKTKSSKMLMLDNVLKEWRKEGSKVLVFCQGTKMLTVLENYARGEMGWPTMRMDGSTPVNKRQLLISRFNRGSISDTFLFLLTTRVGGVGVNLTGATRVVIFDPDWNPSTDAQARERAWRLGQTKPVKVFRFITIGTIEEKIYHRQIFKTFLTNKVLHDPAQRRFFKESDLRDLFTLTDDAAQNGGRSETAEMFSDDNVTVKEHDEVDSGRKKKKKKRDVDEAEEDADAEADNALLKNLFKSDEVFKEAFDHSRMEMAAQSQRERVVAEKRALIAAQKAQRQFLQELRNIQSQPINIPTYTGSARSVAPPSAAMLIAGGNIWRDNEGDTEGETDGDVHVTVLRELRKALINAGKKGLPTVELKKIGEKYLRKLDEGVEVFKSLLHAVATLDEKKKRWFLKKEFQPRGGAASSSSSPSS